MKKTMGILIAFGALSAAFLILSVTLTHEGSSIYFSGFLTGIVTAKIASDSVWNLVIYILSVTVCIVVPYMLGSINFAIRISREKHHDDVRKYGSHNAGMTNMIRVYGKADGIATLVGDALKTSTAVLMGRFLIGEFGAYLAALFCVLGHIAPVWYKFRGGKGVVASAMAILILDPLYFAVVFTAFVAVYFLFHFVSMASVFAAFIYPAVVFYGTRLRSTAETSASAPAMIFAVFVGLMVIYMHRENLRRVYYGEEKKMYLSRKKRDAQKAAEAAEKAEK